ncbi:hypothetical protein ACWEQL_10880 [Kitasatospora sp. NPDC004240]
MKRTRIAAVLLSAVLAPALVACSGGGDEPAKPAAVPTTLPTSTETKAVVQGFETVPQSTLAAYLDTLRGIDPALAQNDVNAWQQGIHLCYRAYGGLPQDQLVTAAGQAFASEKGEAIVAAAQKHLCGVKAVRDEWEKHRPRSP